MKQLTALEIVQLLTQKTDQQLAEMQTYFESTGRLHPEHGYLIERRVRNEAPVRELVNALVLTTDPFVRQRLCEILGRVHARSAVPVLIKCLNDNSSKVRSAAVDALARIRSPKAGEPLLHRFSKEGNTGTRREIATALGAVKYKPSIPHLVAALQEKDGVIRANAAWSLGVMRAVDAKEALLHRLDHESDVHVREYIQQALMLLEGTEANV